MLKRTRALVALLAVASVVVLANGSWNCEIQSAEWRVWDSLPWAGCWYSDPKPPRYFLEYSTAGLFPKSDPSGAFTAFCHDVDPSVHDHIGIQIKLTATVLDETWRSWVDHSRLAPEAALILDGIARLRPVVVLLQVALRDRTCGLTPIGFTYKQPCPAQKYGPDDYHRVELTGFPLGVTVFPDGAIVFGLPSSDEILVSFDLFLRDAGCDSWHDDPIEHRGRITFRCWRE